MVGLMMRGRRFATLLALGLGTFLLWEGTAHAALRPVEVRILERRVNRTVEVRAPQGAVRIPGHPTGGRLRLEARGNAVWLEGRPLSTPELRIGSSPGAGGFEVRWPGNRRTYAGSLRVRAERNQLTLLNEVPLETYVAGVVSAEMPEHWPVAAHRAQAVLARTLALRGGDHEQGRLCDLTHCQVYAGARVPEAMQAAQDTWGQVLTYQGALIQPLFHATCGGERVSNATVFGGAPVPYLQPGTDPFCAASPHARAWSVRILPSELARALGMPDVSHLEVSDRSAGGWVGQVIVDDRPLSGYRFWQAVGRELGWGVLKSMRFGVRRDGEAFVFEGSGLGHGVGLCQWGARGQAERGIPYARILGSYYPGTAIARR